MAWQFSSQQPIYQQIVDAISMQVFSGAYAPGDRLPSVRELAVVAAVNPNTMQRALSELENMGLVTTQRNSGRSVTTDETVVVRARKEKALLLAETFLSQMRSLGMDKQEVLSLIGGMESKEENDGTTGNA